MSEIVASLSWTFFQEISPLAISEEIKSILLEDEEVFQAFKTIRDTAVFTDCRIIICDSQGITGKKKEIYTIPYDIINMWSSENKGTLDLNSEIQLFTRSGAFKIKIANSIDIRKIDKLIAKRVLKRK